MEENLEVAYAPLKGVGALLAVQALALLVTVHHGGQTLALAALVTTAVAQTVYRYQISVVATRSTQVTAFSAAENRRAMACHLVAAAVALAWPRPGALALLVLGLPAMGTTALRFVLQPGRRHT